MGKRPPPPENGGGRYSYDILSLAWFKTVPPADFPDAEATPLVVCDLG